jgi:hypothetical protein
MRGPCQRGDPTPVAGGQEVGRDTTVQLATTPMQPSARRSSGSWESHLSSTAVRQMVMPLTQRQL